MPSLEQSTRSYWDVSKEFYVGIGLGLTTSDAIHFLGVNADNLGPQRRLKWRVLWLQDRIVQGRKRKKPESISNIIPFRARI